MNSTHKRQFEHALDLVMSWPWTPEDCTFKDVASLSSYIEDIAEHDGIDIDVVDAGILADIVAYRNPEIITGKDTQDGEPLDNQ